MTITSRHLTAAAALTLAATLTSTGAATAAPAHRPAPRVTVLSTSYVFPLQFAVAHGGQVYVADGPSVFRLGRARPVATASGHLGATGVEVERQGPFAVAYTSGDPQVGRSYLTVKPARGRPVTADLHAFEATHNPDKVNAYGVKNPSPCVKAGLESGPQAPPAAYTGQVDSNPYAVADAGSGWYVADAGGNDIVKVDKHGKVSLVAVLPPQPAVITPELATALSAPACVVGVTYAFEPVPTDVERGPDGMLYVSTLPGGAEGPASGTRGSVYRVNPRNGTAERIATGFAGATNVAVDDHGTVYVAEFFGGRISVVRDGRPCPLLDLPGVSAVEWQDGHLYAATVAPMDAQGVPHGKGSIVRIDL